MKLKRSGTVLKGRLPVQRQRLLSPKEFNVGNRILAHVDTKTGESWLSTGDATSRVYSPDEVVIEVSSVQQSGRDTSVLFQITLDNLVVLLEKDGNYFVEQVSRHQSSK